MSGLLLEDRVALVTGGARGIGRAIVEDLVRHGANVVIADNGTGIDGTGSGPEPARELAMQLGDRAIAVTDSIASPSVADGAVAAAVDAFGALDILVNNAAILRDAFVFKGAAGDWDAVIRFTPSSVSISVATCARPKTVNARSRMRSTARRRPRCCLNGRLPLSCGRGGCHGDEPA